MSSRLELPVPRKKKKTSGETPPQLPLATTRCLRIEETPTETTRNIEPSPEVSPSPERETPVEFHPHPRKEPQSRSNPQNPPTPETKAVEKLPVKSAACPREEQKTSEDTPDTPATTPISDRRNSHGNYP
jgi:hypothetical protein